MSVVKSLDDLLILSTKQYGGDPYISSVYTEMDDKIKVHIGKYLFTNNQKPYVCITT